MQQSASDVLPLDRVIMESPSKRRIREIVELNRQVNIKLREQEQAQQVAQRAKYNTRWRHLRALYSYRKLHSPSTAGLVSEQSEPSQRHNDDTSKTHKQVFGGALTLACTSLCVEPLVPCLVMESIIYSALSLDSRDPACQSLVRTFLQCMYEAAPSPKPGTNFVDYRAICCMWDVLEHPTFVPLKRLSRWFDIYCTNSARDPSKVVLRMQDIRPMFSVISPDAIAEMEIDVFMRDLFQSMREIESEELALPGLLRFADEHYGLQVLIRRFCWDNLTEAQRVAIEKDEQDMTAAFVERERQHIQHAKAMAYWMHREPRKRFGRWKLFRENSLRLKRSDGHAVRTQYRKGIKYLVRNRLRVLWMKQMLGAAVKQHTRCLCRTAYDGWWSFWTSSKELEWLASQQSYKHYTMTLLHEIFAALVRNAHEQRESKRKLLQRVMVLLQDTNNKLLTNMLSAWKYFVELQKRNRQAAKTQEDLIANMVEFDRYRREQFEMEREDAISTQMRAEELADIERARKVRFREQTRQAYVNRKIKKQEQLRTALKKEREESAAKLADEAWTTIEQLAQAKARAAAEDWLKTPEGQAEVQAAATYIYEDPPNTVAQNLKKDPTYSSVADCVWVCRLEATGGRYAKAYFYHTERLEKVMCDELTMKVCTAIASEQLIQKRINAMKVTLAQRGEEERVKFQRNAAAKRIQMMVRCRKARKYVRSIMRPLLMKRIDPSTGRVVYFNIHSRETSFVPPRMIAAVEGSLPVESTTWVRRFDSTSGEHYYVDLTTNETSWTPPNHYVMCVKCRINFCTQRNTTTGERYCVSCFADMAYAERESDKAKEASGEKVPEREKEWSRIAVVVAKCCVCKANNATRLCHECGGDTSCDRCFTLVHKNPKVKHHTRHESVLYQVAA
ncbi:hypothetical protein LEN26_005745 [Aphanomyces euteiches]|nr:hypothetical protein AeMF1_000415 [Aphanomyces euteiches]KAH9137419.1 hypothetical protein LEN26_005745 [Aphanomyces euteiches]KAH9189415.1 hypothetical protein AeNC1_008606 [Aphanomyces euteiches]